MSASTGHQTAPVTFLVDDAFGGDGVARTVANVANQLARTHPVRVISFHRRRDLPSFPLNESIPVTVVRDLRKIDDGRIARLLVKHPSRLRPTPSPRHMSLLTDLLLRREIRRVRSGFLITSRPSLHLAAVSFARRGVSTIGWDHLNFPQRFGQPDQFNVLRAAIARMAGFAVLTQEDADDYRRALPGIDTEIAVIRNSVSWPVAAEAAPLDSKVVLAAGRLVPRKGMGRLIHSFAPVAREHPDWQLHVYGAGKLEADLRRLIAEQGLGDQVQLRGYSNNFHEVLASASCFAMGSKQEGFPMVLIEALSVGVPIVAFDCPRGPGEIVDDGANGLLVPDGDGPAFTTALRTMVEDSELRRKLGARGLADAQQYVVERICGDWENLFERASAGRADSPRAVRSPNGLGSRGALWRPWNGMVRASRSGRSAGLTGG